MGRNAPAGITRTMHEDAVTGAFTVESVQDVTEIVAANKASYAATRQRAPCTGDGIHRYASIPLGIYFDLVKQGITRDPVAMKRWLNDPDNLAFRTRPGKV